MVQKPRSTAKSDPVVDEYLNKGLHITHAQYIDNAVWSAIREAIENKNSSSLRKQIQEACEPILIAEAYAWKYKQGNNETDNNLLNKH